MDRVFGDFDKADPTKSGGGSPWLEGYSVNVVEIKVVKVKESEKDDKIHFIVEYVVLETNRDDIKVGDIEYGWVHDLTNKWYGKENAKQFLAAALGVDPASEEALALDQDAVEEAVGESQPLAGIKVRLETKPKSRQDKSDFTVHEWTPYDENEAKAAEG